MWFEKLHCNTSWKFRTQLVVVHKLFKTWFISCIDYVETVKMLGISIFRAYLKPQILGLSRSMYLAFDHFLGLISTGVETMFFSKIQSANVINHMLRAKTVCSPNASQTFSPQIGSIERCES